MGIILQDIAWENLSTYHITTLASPGQLVFGRDLLFNITYTSDRQNQHTEYQR